jgi:hypothetical protein
MVKSASTTPPTASAFSIFFARLVHIFKIIYGIIVTFRRDVRGIFTYFRILNKSKHVDKKNYCVADVVGQWVKKQPQKPCIIFNEKTWTFLDVIITILCLIKLNLENTSLLQFSDGIVRE